MRFNTKNSSNPIAQFLEIIRVCVSLIGMIAAVALAIALGLAVYFLPVVVAAKRKHPAIGGIFFVTMLTAWTGIGWIATLIWSFITPQAPIVIAPPPLAVQGGSAQELERLANLMDRGLITPEEYAAQKQKVLNG